MEPYRGELGWKTYAVIFAVALLILWVCSGCGSTHSVTTPTVRFEGFSLGYARGDRDALGSNGSGQTFQGNSEDEGYFVAAHFGMVDVAEEDSLRAHRRAQAETASRLVALAEEARAAREALKVSVESQETRSDPGPVQGPPEAGRATRLRLLFREFPVEFSLLAIGLLLAAPTGLLLWKQYRTSSPPTDPSPT